MMAPFPQLKQPPLNPERFTPWVNQGAATTNTSPNVLLANILALLS